MNAVGIVTALTRPPPAGTLRGADWTRLLRQARVLNVLPQLAHVYEGQEGVPAEVERHFEAARRVVARLQQDVLRETAHVRHALAGLDAPIVVLKGAAYVLRGLEAARGRTFSDLDLLVPRAAIATAEDRLIRAGWLGTHHNTYDQRYYRQWMHEIPPMRHLHRGSVIDLHHTITPPTSRFPVEGGRLLSGLTAIDGQPGCFTLAAEDMVLHAVIHRFTEGEWNNGFRDLFDLHRLLTGFDAQPDFSARLGARAAELGLSYPLRSLLRPLRSIFGTPAAAALERQLAGTRKYPAEWLTARLFAQVLTPRPPDSPPPEQRFAASLLYLRAHWLRMPPLLLARHLARKALHPAQH